MSVYVGYTLLCCSQSTRVHLTLDGSFDSFPDRDDVCYHSRNHRPERLVTKGIEDPTVLVETGRKDRPGDHVKVSRLSIPSQDN